VLATLERSGQTLTTLTTLATLTTAAGVIVQVRHRGVVPLHIETFRAVLDPGQLVDLRERLGRSRWPGVPSGGWEAGVPQAWLRELVAAWQQFDVAQFQRRLDALEHLRVDMDGQLVHAVRAAGNGPDPLPLLLTHGWPGSFCEYLDGWCLSPRGAASAS